MSGAGRKRHVRDVHPCPVRAPAPPGRRYRGGWGRSRAARERGRSGRSASSSRRRSLAGGVVPAGHRARRRRPAGRPPPRAGARRWRRSRPRSPRGWPRRCRSRSRSWRPPRASRRGSSGPTRGTSPRSAAWATRTLASTCGRWLTTASRRSWALGVDRRRPRAEGRDQPVQALVEQSRRGLGGRQVPDARPRTGPRGRARRPAVSAPAIGCPPTNRSSRTPATMRALDRAHVGDHAPRRRRGQRRSDLIGQSAHRSAAEARLGALQRLLQRAGGARRWRPARRARSSRSGGASAARDLHVFDPLAGGQADRAPDQARRRGRRSSCRAAGAHGSCQSLEHRRPWCPSPCRRR